MKESASQNSLSERLAVLADATRLRVLHALEQHELTVGELAKVLQSPQSTISRHLKILADSGWLTRRSEGPASFYRLVLDELAPELRDLWLPVRAQTRLGAEAVDDARRVAAVLAERRTDSQAFFGRIAGEWDAVRTQLFGSNFTAPALLSLLPPGLVIADLGCGTGNIAELLAPVAGRVVAIDQSEPMLTAARQRLAGVGNVDFVAADLTALPLSDGSVDAAVLALVLHHCDEPGRVLKEVRRILRPGRAGQLGGACLVLDMVRHQRAEYRHQMGHKHLGFARARIEGLLHEAGLGTAGSGGVRYGDLPVDAAGKGPGLFVAVARRE